MMGHGRMVRGDDGGAVAGGGAGMGGVGGEAQTAGVVSGRWQGGGGGAALTGPWERGHGGRPRRDRDLPSPVFRPTTQGHPRASRHARPRFVTARGPPVLGNLRPGVDVTVETPLSISSSGIVTWGGSCIFQGVIFVI